MNDCVYCVGTLVAMYPSWRDPGSPTVSMCTWVYDTSYFYIMYRVA